MWDVVAAMLKVAPLDTTGSLIIRRAREQLARDGMAAFIKSHPRATEGWESPVREEQECIL